MGRSSIGQKLSNSTPGDPGQWCHLGTTSLCAYGSTVIDLIVLLPEEALPKIHLNSEKPAAPSMSSVMCELAEPTSLASHFHPTRGEQTKQESV